MFTASSHPVRGARRRTVLVVAVAAIGSTLLAGSTATRDNAGVASAQQDLDSLIEEYERLEELEETVEHEGRVPTHQLYRRDTVEAAFAHESYRPGAIGRLVIHTPAHRVRIRIFRAGVEEHPTRRTDRMNGEPVSAERTLYNVRSGQVVPIRLGRWPSGLYFARLTSPGKVGYAPFVLRPWRLGEHAVAVVLPTYTWQAYNFRDDDRDGYSDTWYAGWRTNHARLNRPYLDRGVPAHFRVYDLPFLRWLHATGRQVDVLGDADLNGLRSGAKLARYELLIFPGHHEYVTTREYDAVVDFRNRGGNLMFLSANNFYWRVDLRGDVMTRVQHWRDLGRPEAALIGTQYVANDDGRRRGAWVVRRTPAVSWIFAGTGSSPGEAFSEAGIEIDSVASSSPRGTQILASIPSIYGRGYNAHMTYYQTRRGAKVFAAGAFTLAGAIWQPPVRRLLTNLWRRLASGR